ncbi:hypothetical protein ACLK2F_12000 [Escherichia coli]
MAWAKPKSWLVDYFNQAEGDFFVCTPEEGSKAFLHRFAAAGAAIRYQAVHSDEVEDILALDIALRGATTPSGMSIYRRRSTASWCTSSITAILCAMSSIRIT